MPALKTRVVEVIATGEEVLSGQIINTNFAKIAQLLLEQDLEVRYGVIIGDSETDLIKALEYATQRSSIVIINGGLGPTSDDVTRSAAAKFFNKPLIADASATAKLKDYAQSRGYQLSENSLRQAMLPEGSVIINNPLGTASGFCHQLNNTHFYFTSGVPQELIYMLNNFIVPHLKELLPKVDKPMTARLSFNCRGLPESLADKTMQSVNKHLSQILPKQITCQIGFRIQTHQLEIKVKLSTPTPLDSFDDLTKQAEHYIRQRLQQHLID